MSRTRGDAIIYRDDLVSTNATLFSGAINQAGIIASSVGPHTGYGRAFWQAVAAQDFWGEDGWEDATLLSEPVMVKALAALAYTFHDSREKDHAIRNRFIADLAAKKINFAHDDELWQIYFKTDAERAAIDPRLVDYLKPDAGRKGYAFWQSDRLSFAQNTRDIARYLGDLIRWKLDLPPHPGVATLRAKLIAQGKMADPAAAAVEQANAA